MRKSFQRCFYMLAVLAVLFGITSTGVMAEETFANSDFIFGGIGDGITITGYNGNGGEVVIPDALGVNKVVAIERAAFSYCDEITSIIIPGGVTSIGEEAFYHCNGLANIEIPDSVTFIDKSAFEYCDKLTSITLPKSITAISSYTFTKCSGLTSLKIPDGVTTIGWAAFSYCSGLNRIEIPSSVTSIAGLAFIGHNENLVIYGVGGSYAETYARGEGIPFIADEESSIVQEVIEKIDSLPAEDNLKLTDKTAVIEARTSYNSLTANQKASVSNYDKLIKAEEKITELEAEDDKQIPQLSYCTHVQNVGWQDYVGTGMMSGTEGKSYRLEGIKIKLDNQGYDLGITYQTHIQNVGWEADTSSGWKSNDNMSGTEGLSYRLEAIQIKLTGADADKFDIYYQVHAQNFGWLGWAKNGESAGTAGFGYRLEGIRIQIVPTGSTAPGSTQNAFVQPSAVEQVLNKMNGNWLYQYSGGKYIYRITKTSPSTGHFVYEQYVGGGDAMEFDFKINSINSDGTTTLIMDMNSIKSIGITPNFSTIPVNPLMDQPNSIKFFKANFNRL